MSFAAVGLYVTSLMASPQPFAVQLAAVPDSVSGHVIDARSRTPIAGATVILLPAVQEVPPGAVATLETVTDGNGEFVFYPLRGRYRIEARKTGFARLSDPSDAQTIDVARGHSVTDIELTLQPGAVIAGRIVDASGGFPREVTVSALRQRTGPGRPHSCHDGGDGANKRSGGISASQSG